MSFLLEKTETKSEIVYKVRSKLWYGIGWPVFVFVIISIIFNKIPIIWMAAVFTVYIWLIIIAIGCFPVWWAYLSGKKTITRLGKGWMIHNAVWRIKK